MKRTIAAVIAVAGLTACGDGNPFNTDGDPPMAPPASPPVSAGIPPEVSDALADFTYDPMTQTLSITGITRDGNEVTQSYTRAAALDQGPYRAYRFQDDPLDEHTTVYVRRLDTVEAATAVTGGQFTFFSGGALYDRTGAYDPIVPDNATDRGLVSYAGQYVGLSDLPGPNTDLTPVAPGTPNEIQPDQAAPVTGDIFVNVSFSDNNLAGRVYNRTIDVSGLGTVAVPDIILTPSTLETDGTFAGVIEIPTATGSRAEVGDFGGVIGGTQASVVAGALYAVEHFDTAITVTDEEEYGIFVLGRCGGPNQDASAAAICAQVDPQ